METAFESPTRAWLGVPQRTQANRNSLEQIKSIPAEVQNTFWAVDWFNSVNQFRMAETEYLSQGEEKFNELLVHHRVIVSELISQGETLVAAITMSGMAVDAGFSLDDLRATIESLRETFKGVHGPHNHPETHKAILSILEAA